MLTFETCLIVVAQRLIIFGWVSQYAVERSKDWLDQAEWDPMHAKNDMDCEFCDWVYFSTQQAAKKALKAIFQKLGY